MSAEPPARQEQPPISGGDADRRPGISEARADRLAVAESLPRLVRLALTLAAYERAIDCRPDSELVHLVEHRHRAAVRAVAERWNERWRRPSHTVRTDAQREEADAAGLGFRRNF